MKKIIFYGSVEDMPYEKLLSNIKNFEEILRYPPYSISVDDFGEKYTRENLSKFKNELRKRKINKLNKL